MFNKEEVEKYLLFKVIAGSNAYGLNTPESDVDIKGIFLIPNEYRLGNGYIEQISNPTNDITFYELNRFMNLLSENNPNIIEMLFTPKDKILFMDNRFEYLYENRHQFLTKQIQSTFGGYAISQIKKARGLNKKIVRPVDKEKKTPLDFCYIYEKDNGYMMTAKQWLRKHNKEQEYIGLSELPNGVQTYKVYYDYDKCLGFKGIELENSNEVRHSEIPKEYPLEAFLFFNKDGYSTYCKDYKEYWEWVEKRNPNRYNDNISHNQNYDGKNMMHCLRLLDTAIQVAETGTIDLVRKG